jgi:hypothetical protein
VRGLPRGRGRVREPFPVAGDPVEPARDAVRQRLYGDAPLPRVALTLGSGVDGVAHLDEDA